MKLYYTIADNYPPYRVDLVELYENELRNIGVTTRWFTDAPTTENYTVANIDAKFPSFSTSRLVRKVKYWTYDVCCILGCIFDKPDAFQARDKYIGAIFALLASKLLNVPFIYWCSYPFPEHYAERSEREKGFKWLYSKLHSAFGHIVLYKIVMPHSDHVFVQSQKMKEDFSALGIKLDKMTAVPMGASRQLIDWATSQKTLKQDGKIVYVGTLAEIRRLDMIIRSFAKIATHYPKAHLWMIGDGDHPSDRQRLVLLCNQLGISQRVTFTGFVPMHDAWVHASQAEVCLSPFYPTPVLSVASPTKLVEYLALGCAVVCNDHPEQSEVAKESGAALCVPWDEDCFANAISTLLENQDLRDQLSSNGPEWVKNNRSYEVIAQMVHSKYIDVLRKNMA